MRDAMRLARSGVLAVLLFAPAAAAGQDLIPESVRQNLREKVDAGYWPSVVVGAVDATGRREYFAYGQTAVGNGRAADERTVYATGSIGKTFTTLVLAQLVLEGKVSLDDPIQRYLPAQVRAPTDAAGRQITLRHLATHNSGLPRGPTNFRGEIPFDPFTDYLNADLYAFLNEHTITGEIDGEPVYSNLAMGLLGHLLSLIDEKAGYEQMIIDRIGEPLGLSTVRVRHTIDMLKRAARKYRNGQEVPIWQWYTPDGEAVLVGAGGLRTSAEDLLTFAAANAGIIHTSLAAAMEYTHVPRSSNGVFGLGWVIVPREGGDPLIWHNGSTNGFRSFTGFIKERKAVAVLANDLPSVDNIGRHLLDPDANPLVPVRREPVSSGAGAGGADPGPDPGSGA